MKRFPVAIVCVLTVTMGWGIARAGDLNPPVGPVAPTHKTLTEVEPRIAVNATNTPGDADSLFKITQRGSYYLTGNIIGVVGKHGIEIDAQDVTLDLNGFSIIGAAGGLSGIKVSSARRNIAILSGACSGWPGAGLDAGSATSGVIQGILAVGNTGDGIIVGSLCKVTDNLALSNGAAGIKVVGNNSYIDGNICESDGTGVQVSGTGNLIVRNRLRLNTTDYSIAAANNYAQLLSLPGANFAASNPWANFSGCVSGQTECAGACVNVSNDVNNCGTCGNVCPSAAHATASCVNGNCTLTCIDPWADCNNNPADGCEVNTNTSPFNCGGCGIGCSGTCQFGECCNPICP